MSLVNSTMGIVNPLPPYMLNAHMTVTILKYSDYLSDDQNVSELLVRIRIILM